MKFSRTGPFSFQVASFSSANIKKNNQANAFRMPDPGSWALISARGATPLDIRDVNGLPAQVVSAYLEIPNIHPAAPLRLKRKHGALLRKAFSTHKKTCDLLCVVDAIPKGPSTNGMRALVFYTCGSKYLQFKGSDPLIKG